MTFTEGWGYRRLQKRILWSFILTVCCNSFNMSLLGVCFVFTQSSYPYTAQLWLKACNTSNRFCTFAKGVVRSLTQKHSERERESSPTHHYITKLFASLRLYMSNNVIYRHLLYFLLIQFVIRDSNIHSTHYTMPF